MNCLRILAMVLCICFASFGFAQVATGTPPFGSYGGEPFDTVNLATLNTHFNIPIFTKAGRGMPFVFYINYDSSVWYPVTSGSTTSWQYVSTWGWQAQGNTAAGYVTATSKPGYCFDLSTQPPTQIGTTVYTYKSYNDGRGTSHTFAGAVLTDLAPCNRQPAVPPSFTSNDGSGYTITTQAGDPVVTVTPRGGGVMIVPAILGSGQGQNTTNSTDSNGNYISYNGTTFTDTLGKQVLAISGTNPVLYTYTNPAGSTSHVNVSYTTYQIKTAFNCSTVQDVTVLNIPLITQITFADNSSYAFSYEQTPNNSGYYTGRIASVTLPTGGTIKYQYTGANGGIECTDGSAAGLTRTLIPAGSQVGDQWTYTRTVTAPPASNTVVTDPHNNQTSYDFQDIYEARRQIYNSAGVLQKKIVTCYDGQVAPADCPTTAVTPPITHRIVYNYFPDENGLLAKTADTFDSALGMMTHHSETGWNNDGRSVDIFWVGGQNINGAITMRPGTVTTSNYGGVTQAKTVYIYSDAVTATSGTPQHGSVTCTVVGCRGNASSIAYTTQGSSTVTRSFTYYDTGNLRTSTDVNGAVTTYSYGTGSCGNSFVTGTSVNTTPALTRSMTWDSTCNGGVLTSLTDENSKTTTFQYNDPNFWRPTGVQDALSNTTTYSYSPTSREQALPFNSNQSVVDVLSTLDSFGRVSVVQQKQAPGSSNYDSIQYLYDLPDSLLKASALYVGAQGAGMPPGTATSSVQYDALGRATQVVDAGGGTVNSSYYQNDVLTSVVAPAGENNKQRQFEYDGLGRLVSACELTNGYTGAPSGNCAQHSRQTGYWTQYTYNTRDEVMSVAQNSQAGASAQQTRTYTYDMLGRITSETNPEWNDFTHQYSYTYVYDTDTTCGTSNGDMVKRVDAEGTVTCFAYDKLHRLTSVTYPSGTYSNTARKCFVYDSATVNSISMTNAKGRLAEAYTTSGTCASSKITDIGFSYNARGDLTDVYESTPHSGGYYRLTAAYWANGALQTLNGTIGSGMPTISFGVDGEGRASSVTVPPGYGQTPVTGTTYDTANHKATVTFGSTDSDVFTFDAATGRLSKYEYKVNTQTVIGNLGWNSNGTLQSLGITDPLNSQDAQNCNYVYDDLSRLGSANCGSSIWSQTFLYDAFGNIQKSVPSGSTGISFQPTYSSTQYPAATNRFLTLPGVTPSYDKNGNLKGDGNHTYTWDGEGEMLTYDTTGVVLTYDALGRIVEQNRSGVYTEIVYAPMGAKFALMNGQTLVKAFVSLPGATAVYTSWSSGPAYYRHADWLGSSRLATKPDRTLYYDVAYAPFGENYNGKTGTGGAVDLSYTGQNQDTAGGLNDFLFRENNPSHGRWMSPDPAGLIAVDLMDPQSWDRYAYVLNNPLSNIDPLGLDCVYVTGDGEHVESIDHNSDEVECAGNGGYWIEGSVKDASWVTINPDNGIVSGYGVTWDGFIEWSVAGAIGSNTWGAWTQTFGVNGPPTVVDVTDTYDEAAMLAIHDSFSHFPNICSVGINASVGGNRVSVGADLNSSKGLNPMGQVSTPLAPYVSGRYNIGNNGEVPTVRGVSLRFGPPTGPAGTVGVTASGTITSVGANFQITLPGRGKISATAYAGLGNFYQCKR